MANAVVQVFNAARMALIEARAVVGAAVTGDNLTLTRNDGTTIGPFNVRGPKGDTGALGGVLYQSIGAAGNSFAVPNDSTYRRPTFLASLTIPSTGTTNVFRISYSLDVETNSNGAYAVAAFFVDGNQLGVPVAVLRVPSGTIRAPLAKEHRLTGLSAGNHTVEVRVTSLATGTPTVYEHSVVQVQRIS